MLERIESSSWFYSNDSNQSAFGELKMNINQAFDDQHDCSMEWDGIARSYSHQDSTYLAFSMEKEVVADKITPV